MKAKILDIFKSIQGEGKYVGVTQVFVRFFECNMHCDWCDTPASIGDTTRNYKEMECEEVFKQIQDLWPGSHSISLTGGEPLLQKDFIKELVPLTKKARMPIHLETNGVCYKELKDIIDMIEVIAMDIKLPSSTKIRSFWEEHREFLHIAISKDVFVKAVITSDTSEEDIIKARELVAEVDPHILFILQPNSYELNNGVINRCLELEMISKKQLYNTRILPQVHKFMKIP